MLIFFAATLFVSAFLLFLVQPMIGKMILPQLGGTPQVWNTCMMFFQLMLLAGYAYSHNVTSKLPVKKQLFVHLIMLLLPVVVLLIPALMFERPFYVGGFGAEGGGNPILDTLILLTIIVGVPFLVVSTTAPLLQRWFNQTGHPAAKDPYFLYGAGNAGSILGLLMYPVAIEYLLGLQEQAWFWFWGYLVLLVMVGGCAFIVGKADRPWFSCPAKMPTLRRRPNRLRAIFPCRRLLRRAQALSQARLPPLEQRGSSAAASSADGAGAVRLFQAPSKDRRSTSRKRWSRKSRTKGLTRSRRCVGCDGSAWLLCQSA